MKVKSALRKMIEFIYPDILYRKNSYSQDGEDVILNSFFEGRKHYKGFYVDVGAHHPLRFSNTALFYKKGWEGINIEPTPSLMKNFTKYRKRDINLNMGISNAKGVITFFMFDDPALNSFDEKLSTERNNTTRYKIIDKVKIETCSLSEVLDKYLPVGQRIDFLNIDAEGFDLEVIKSNDWDKYRPTFILIEDNIFDFNRIEENEMYSCVINMDYKLVAKTTRTCVFQSVSNKVDKIHL